ncbi:MAG: hypothetical protein KGY65_07700 [Candidatus Thermoplasmatota archaeon]|nr:hypothetical protein [Candidatus Thermoplasmatota archaeon]MBS3802617.1 hypothetical protein [Candidatus Thermoplasmatota archaeon]
MELGGNTCLKHKRRKIIRHDTNAVSETFTVLPALAMVLIGFTIFSIIIATAYTTFDTKKEYVAMVEYSDQILEKISSPNACFTTDGNTINYLVFSSNQSKHYIETVKSQFAPYQLCFSVKLSFEQVEIWLPQPISNNYSIGNQYASSKQVSVQINEIKTLPGTLTVVLWQKTR